MRGLVAGAVVIVLIVLMALLVVTSRNDPPPRSARYLTDLDSCRREADVRFTPKSQDWRSAITVCMVVKGHGSSND